MALERIHYTQAENAQSKKNKRKQLDVLKEPGCSWAINSADHNYCFWNFSKSLSAPVQDREICQLLGINQIQLREDYNKAVKKLQSMTDQPIMKEFLALIIDKIQSDKNMDIYSVQEEAEGTIDKIESDEKELEREEEMRAEIAAIKKKRKGKNYSGQPMHRDGKKVDLFGLGSQKKQNEDN